ncbi:peptidase M14 [Neomegalonema sp.]|uniref:peptidase M14 n=1 Tax=Neomegalonema sp. TaxID=2039713 RepID=UPI00260C64A2|nr:peptidase M14 [Neomegalonema sp.]MDD2868622.1 peptidase M14 [Neomegalonema sp.]
MRTPVILSASFPRTLEILARRLRDAAAPVEIWSFDGPQARRDHEARLGARGVEARIRSAYKPLLHAFLEEIPTEGLIRAEILHPVHPAATRRRFQLEAYPLAGLFPETEFAFLPAPSGEDLTYRLRLFRRDGPEQEMEVFAPNRLHPDPTGALVLSPTGWLKIGAGDPGERIETELEALFAAALRAVPKAGFEELRLSARIPMPDQPLGFGEEVVSLQEALHEDLYFSLLELLGERPGQIVPEVGLGPPEAARLTIEARPLDANDPQSAARDSAPLAGLQAPPSPERVARELAALGGVSFEARSRAGRVLRGVHLQGSDAPMLLTAGQHANETTGIVGALRAAREIAARPGAHLAVTPLDNPDGYALHRRLTRENPRHMHHAARFTAWGEDLERGPPEAEAAIRSAALKLCPARLHVNLHGYPAHEWTRPFSGYLPRGYETWTLPKGFFLILRHKPGSTAFAEALLTRIARDLAEAPGLLDFTRAQMRLAEAHAGPLGFRLVEGFPCLVSVRSDLRTEVELVTEYPDETILGPAFVRGHEAQTRAALAAYEALQVLAGSEA